MNRKDRLDAVLHGKKADIIPWTIYASYPPWGEVERKYRNMGLIMIYQHFPIIKTSLPEVTVTENNRYDLNNNKGKYSVLRKFETPAGNISVRHQFFTDSLPVPGDLIQKFGSEIDMELLSWITEYPFKDESDYEALEYIYKNVEFKSNYEDFLFTDEIVGDDGYVMVNMGKSPFQMILYELMGTERCYLELIANPNKFKSLYNVIYEHQKRKYEIAVKSLATIIWVPENLTSILTPPDYFEEYSVPFYNEMAEMVHKENKLYAVHIDGSIDPIAGLIGKTDIDIIEAFTPPPMGDYPVADALKNWKDKVVWINFPGVILATYDEASIEAYTIELLKSVAPGDRFAIGCTESFPMERWEMAFGAIGRALEKCGKYPIKS